MLGGRCCSSGAGGVTQDGHSLLRSSLLRIPGVLAAASLLLALRHLEAESLVVECRDSASVGSALPTLIVALLLGTFSVAARRMMVGSGVGRPPRADPRGARKATGGEVGGGRGREGLRWRTGEVSGRVRFTTAESTTRNVFVSQDNFTYRVSVLPEAGKGAPASRCLTCHTAEE